MDNYIGYSNYGYYGGGWTYILLLIAFVFSLICSSMVKSTYAKYSKVLAQSGLTAAEAARKILSREGIYDVNVVKIPGSLTDNYNSSTKTLSLSETVYDSTSVAAIGVAAHECGHAMQYSEGYFPLIARNKVVPLANFGTKAAVPIIIVGAIISFLRPLITIGILMYTVFVFFQVVTLPVEFDASRRALATIEDMGIVREDEMPGAKKVLKSAAMTYVAAAASAILSLIRLILIYGGRGRKRD